MRHCLVALATIMIAAPLAAQGPGPAGLRANTASPVDPRWTSSFAAASVPESEWKKGMIIGGVVGAAAGLLLAAALSGLCEGSSCGGPGAYGGAMLVSAAIFSLIGGLIGSMFPRN